MTHTPRHPRRGPQNALQRVELGAHRPEKRQIGANRRATGFPLRSAYGPRSARSRPIHPGGSVFNRRKGVNLRAALTPSTPGYQMSYAPFALRPLSRLTRLAQDNGETREN